MKKEKNDLCQHILRKRILYTIIIVLIYMIGRHIYLYNVDLSVYNTAELDAQSVFMEIISGDYNTNSVFSLGLWPYMMGSILVMIYGAIKNANSSSKISPKKLSRLTIELTMVFGVFQAYQKVNSIQFLDTQNLELVRCIVFLEMIVGMLIVIYLCDRNMKYGIGNRLSIFMVNIVCGLFSSIASKPWRELVIPLAIGAFEILIMLILETTEKRIPVQRVSIHNIYANKNYIAIKLNPVGIMPVIFASATFMVPQMILNLLYMFYPNETLYTIKQEMVMTHPVGIITYLVCIWLLMILFAFVMLSPKRMAETLLKSGDSILDIYAGKKTKRYLVGNVVRFSIISSIILSICIGGPLVLSFFGYIDKSLAMTPSSIMMFTGIWITYYREGKVYYNLDHYKPLV